eukprot:gene3385-5930_t
MKVEELNELFEVYPEVSNIYISFGENTEQLHLHILSKFSNLEMLTISFQHGSSFLKEVNSYLKTLKNSKITSFVLDNFGDEIEHEDIEEYFDLIFEKFNLESVEIPFDSMTKPIASKISSYIQNNSKVEVLEMNCTENEYGSLDFIFNSLIQNKSISDLCFSGYSPMELNLKSDSTLEFIKYNHSITYLNFSFIIFTENQIALLDDCLIETTIGHLDLSSSNYTGNFSFLRNKNITKLWFQNIFDLYEELEENFVGELKKNTTLKDLDISRTDKEYISIDSLIDVLCGHTSLETLALSEISSLFTSNNLKNIFKSSTLKTINLSSNKVESDRNPMMIILKSINNNKNLTSLNLSNCDIGKLDDFLNGFSIENTSITEINLNHNFIKFDQESTFLKSILSLPKLENLRVINNHFNKKGIELLSKYLETTTTLKHLSIFDSFLLCDIDAMKTFRDSLNKNTSLKKLEITSNFYYYFEEKTNDKTKWYYNPYINSKQTDHMSENCLRYLLNSDWSKSMSLNEIELQIDLENRNVFDIFRRFFEMNVSVEHFAFNSFSSVIPDLSRSLEFNTNMKSINFVHQPKVLKLLARNEKFSKIDEHFKQKFNSSDIHFQFIN